MCVQKMMVCQVVCIRYALLTADRRHRLPTKIPSYRRLFASGDPSSTASSRSSASRSRFEPRGACGHDPSRVSCCALVATETVGEAKPMFGASMESWRTEDAFEDPRAPRFEPLDCCAAAAAAGLLLARPEFFAVVSAAAAAVGTSLASWTALVPSAAASAEPGQICAVNMLKFVMR